MAIKPKFSKHDFQKILSRYNLGKCKKTTSFKSGAVQTNILLDLTSGKFMFRYYETRSVQYAQFEINVLRYLTKHAYPSPEPVSNQVGEFLGKYKSKPFVLLKFLTGKRNNSRNNGKQIARAISQLHKITIRYKPKNFEFRDSYDNKSCLKNANSNIKKMKSKLEAQNRKKWLQSELNKLTMPKKLPKGVCHCDTHPSNFLYKKGKLSGVLDFDDASYTCLLYDVANLIYFWAWPHKKKLIFNKAKNLIREYEKYRKLTRAEKKHLYDLLKMVIFMSIGWFIHDDNDFNSEKNKIEFLNSLGREIFYDKLFN